MVESTAFGSILQGNFVSRAAVARVSRKKYLCEHSARVPRASATVSNVSRKAANCDPFSLAPGFRTVREVLTPIPLRVSGSIPEWLHGKLLRVGPSKFEAPAQDGSLVRFEHWSDGLPFLHCFSISTSGQATYSSRNIAKHIERAIASVPTSKDYKAITVGGATNIPKSPMKKLVEMLLPRTTDPTMPKAPEYPVGVVVEPHTSVRPMMVTTDAPHMLEIDPETFEPRGFISYKDLGIGGHNVCCAHGEFDARENAYYNLLISVAAPQGVIRVVKIKNGHASVVGSIVNVPPSYIHSFGMTENYIVVAVGSGRMNGLKIWKERSFLAGLHFDDSAGTRIYIVQKKTGAVIAVYNAKPCFFLHVVNAFEASDDVVIDVCRYEDEKIIGSMHLATMITQFRGRIPESYLTRYRLPNVTAGRRCSKILLASESVLSPQHMDMPSLNRSFKWKDYTYVYGVSSNETKLPFSAITKHNIKTGDVTVSSANRCFVSEPVFVPDPSGSEEDDGVIVYIELDTRHATAKSALVVLHAKSMSTIARCETPPGTVIPFGFHGEFLLNV